MSEPRKHDRHDAHSPTAVPAAESRHDADLDDPCGIRPALALIADQRWQDFFSQWCRATEVSPAAVQRVRDVAARLARSPSTLDNGDEFLTSAWAVVRDAMDRALTARDPTHTPSLEATA